MLHDTMGLSTERHRKPPVLAFILMNATRDIETMLQWMMKSTSLGGVLKVNMVEL